MFDFASRRERRLWLLVLVDIGFNVLASALAVGLGLAFRWRRS